MSKDVFISHSTKDVKVADKICEYLEKNNIECFIAPRDLIPGRVYGEEIVRGIDECSTLILIASANSFASQHVLREVERAVNRNMRIIVYKIEDVEVTKSFEYFIMLCQWIDAANTSKIPELPNIIREKNDEPPKMISFDNSRKVKWGKLDNNRKLLIAGVAGLIIIFIFVLLVFKNYEEKNGKTFNNDNNESYNNGQQNDTKPDNPKKYAVGDTFTMGRYNNEDIEWIVLNIDEKGHAYVITKDIISIKAFDSAESGKWNMIDEDNTFERDIEERYTDEELINAKGSSDYSDSNIRIWLNSNDIKVKYTGASPDSNSLYDSRISYDKEAGFLTAFSEDEMKIIVKTNDDLVFLPSVEEVEDYIVKGSIIYPETKVTSAALEADKTGEIKGLAEQYDGNFAWMTRTADKDSCYKVVNVLGNDYTQDGSLYYSDCVGYPRGVRPAMVINP